MNRAESRIAQMEDLARNLAEALRLTQEYVGDELLPNLPGWSHYDARQRYELVTSGGEKT